MDCTARVASRVRRAAETDVPAIRTLLAALGYHVVDDAALCTTLKAMLYRPDLAVFVACAPDATARPLGLLQVSQRPQLQLSGTLVTIDTLVVLPEARGMGIGRRLLRRAAAYARCCRAVRVEVNTTRTRENYRRRFYPANGYEEANAATFRLLSLEDRLGVVANKH